MEWSAFYLSLRLATCSMLILAVIAILIARFLAWRHFRGKAMVEAMVALPLVLPPTVLGFYLLTFFSGNSWLGQLFENLTGSTLVFSFAGLLAASLIYSLPFAVQPMLRAFESIPENLRESAWCCGLSRWQTFLKVEFPLAWPGILSGMVLSFAHTLGEFGVVLMIGGNIPGETRTLSIAIFDRVQAFDDQSAQLMSLVLLIFAFVTISLVFLLNRRRV